jgi:hypothetical protein
MNQMKLLLFLKFHSHLKYLKRQMNPKNLMRLKNHYDLISRLYLMNLKRHLRLMIHFYLKFL